MKKLFSIIFIALAYTQSFAYNLLQVVIESQEVPPTPDGEGAITPFSGPGTPVTTPINFIVPFLFISAMFLTLYILKKNKTKSI